MKNVRISAIAGLIVISLTIIPVITSAAPSTGSSDSSGTPATSEAVTSTATPAPSTSPAVTSATDSGPSTGGSTTSAGTTPGTGSPTTSAGGNTPSTGGSTTSADPAPVVPPSNSGGSNPAPDSGPSRGSRSGGRSGSGIITATATGPVVVLPNSCPLITSPMLRRGINNNAAEVAKLQAFLKNTEGLNVTVNGTFDAATEAAVHAFQKKYVDSVLLPWGGTKSSGIVYITTSKKINQIVCAQPLTLSASEMNIINAYRANIQNRATTPSAAPADDSEIFGGTQTGGTVAVGSSTNTTGTSSVDENTNVASPARTSLAARFWNFIVSLFR